MKKKPSDILKQPPTTPENQQSSIVAAYQGPIPPPAQLERYEQIQPGAADRILRMAEKNQDAQIEQSRAVLEIEKQKIANEETKLQLFSRGQIMSSVIALGGLALTGYGAYTGQNTAMISGLITVLFPFLAKLLPPIGNKKSE
jgi:uncharacterized membrane protein